MKAENYRGEVMNGPKLENGYTRIANEILEIVAKTKLSPTQHCIILTIWRSTYGFNKNEHNMSLSFLSNATGYDKRNIQRELKRLENRKIIKQVIGGNKRVISFNKYFNEWVGETTIGETAIGEIDNRRNYQSTIGETANSTIGETTNQKRKKEIYKESAIDVHFEKMWSLYPSKKGKGRISDSKKKELFNLGDEFERCITRYVKDVEERRSNGFPELKYQNGNTFFNNGYLDYLDENFKNVGNEHEREISQEEISFSFGDYDDYIKKLQEEEFNRPKANLSLVEYGNQEKVYSPKYGGGDVV